MWPCAIRQTLHTFHVTDRIRRATEPYGRWCVGRELNPPAYPIIRHLRSQQPYAFISSRYQCTLPSVLRMTITVHGEELNCTVP